MNRCTATALMHRYTLEATQPQSMRHEAEMPNTFQTRRATGNGMSHHDTREALIQAPGALAIAIIPILGSTIHPSGVCCGVRRCAH